MVIVEILKQTGYYMIVLVLTLFIVAMLMRGFFWKYIKVKTSLGKYVLIKLRVPLRDFFVIGWVEDGFLIYKRRKNILRIAIPKDKNVFYRTLGVNWVDVDEEKAAICSVDYNPIVGHDVEMESNLYVRAVTRPSVSDNREKIMLIIIIVTAIIALVAAFLSYSNYSLLKTISAQLPALAKAVTISGSNTLI